MIRATPGVMALRILAGRAERVARGRALRQAIPRSSHAAWPSAFPERPDPVEMLELSHARRLRQLAPVRWGRMVGSPFAFLRGSAMVMAWDLAHLPHSEIYVQACGDAHLCNFGVSATPERRLIFDTCSYHPPAFRCSADTVGIGRLAFGTDYPFRGSLGRAVDDVRSQHLREDDEAAVLGRTVAHWFA